ncbi:MAG: DUF2938 domain-containing protein [Usitatibacter sp.]
METVMNIAAIGVGATVVMDLWTVIRKQALGIPLPDYGMVGRWLAHMARGTFRHDRIAGSAPMPGERPLGWTAHYATGITFASALVGLWGIDWISRPAIGPALIVGIGSVAAPFFLMQPGMGAGIAASRTPNPTAARTQSLITHSVFGFGLYAAALALNIFIH